MRVGSWRVGARGDVCAGREARTLSMGSQSFIKQRVSMSDLVMVRVGFVYVCLMSGRSFFREVVWHFVCRCLVLVSCDGKSNDHDINGAVVFRVEDVFAF